MYRQILGLISLITVISCSQENIKDSTKESLHVVERQNLSRLTKNNATESDPSFFTVISKINDKEDDVELRSDGKINKTSSDLEMVMDGDDKQVIGIRFKNIEIPNGATIVSAAIQFSADESDSEKCELKTYLKNSEDSKSFKTSDDFSGDWLFSGNWDVPEWNKDEQGEKQLLKLQRTPFNQLFSRSDWLPGNSISLKITSDNTCKRVANSRDGSSSRSPEIKLIYTVDDLSDNFPFENFRSKSFSIKNDKDDIEMSVASDSLNSGSSDLEMVLDGNDKQVIGIRFDQIDLSDSSKILGSNIQFHAKYSDDEDCLLRFEVEDNNNSEQFSDANEFKQRKWKDVGLWNVAPWKEDDKSSAQNYKFSHDIIDGLAGLETSSLSFKIHSDMKCKRRAYSRNGSSLKAPLLNVHYLAGGDTNINLPPVAIDDTYELETTDSELIDVLNNDYDPNGDDLTLYSLTNDSSKGRAEIVGDQIQYSTVLAASFTDEVTYKIKDENGAQATGLLLISYVHNETPIFKKMTISYKGKSSKINFDLNLGLNSFKSMDILKDGQKSFTALSGVAYQIQYRQPEGYVCSESSSLTGMLNNDLLIFIECQEMIIERRKLSIKFEGSYPNQLTLSGSVDGRVISDTIVAGQTRQYTESKDSQYNIEIPSFSDANCSVYGELKGTLNKDKIIQIKCEKIIIPNNRILVQYSGIYPNSINLSGEIDSTNIQSQINSGESVSYEAKQGTRYNLLIAPIDEVRCQVNGNLIGVLNSDQTIVISCEQAVGEEINPTFLAPQLRVSFTGNMSTTASVIWKTKSSSSIEQIHYGKIDQGLYIGNYPSIAEASEKMTEINSGITNTVVRLTELEPDTRYYFIINRDGEYSKRYWFKTLPDTNTARLSFIAGGDSRNNWDVRRKANRLVAKLYADAVLFGGDFTISGTTSQWDTWLNDWQLTITSDGRVTPIVAARGNHEDHPREVHNMFDTNEGSYFATTAGGNLVRAYTLNSEIANSGDQKNWFEQDFTTQAKNYIWNMAQYHKPMRPHTKGKSEGTEMYDNYANLFADYNMNLVFECDSHLVKTTYPVRPPKSSESDDEGFVRDDENGTTYVGEGTWGAPLRGNDDDKTWTRNSGSFNQFKWIFIDKNKIELRTVKYENVEAVSSLSESNKFDIPAGLDVWSPNGESVIVIDSNKDASISIKSPTTGTFFSELEKTVVEISADSTASPIEKVELYVDGEFIGRDETKPYAIDWDIPSAGEYSLKAKMIRFDGSEKESTITRVAALIKTVRKEITNGDDDIEVTGSSLNKTSSDLEMVMDGSKKQMIGLRFSGLQIPKGAEVSSAYIQFHSKKNASENCPLEVTLEQTSHALDFNEVKSEQDLESRFSSSAYVQDWLPKAWGSGQRGELQRYNIESSSLQSLFDREDWTKGNAVAFKISSKVNCVRSAHSANAKDSESKAPELVISFSGGEEVELGDLSDPTSLNELFYKTTTFNDLNKSQYYMRPVFADYPQKYNVTENGLLMKHDASEPFSMSNRIEDRAEIRETNNKTYPQNGTTQVYQVQFKKVQFPERLFGKIHIFQRFNRDNDGPDCGLALMGANQWDGIYKEKSVFVHCFDEYHRFDDVFLKEQNDLVLAIYNHGSEGRYKVSLNGKVLADVQGVDTSAAEDGTWTQTGIYPSGLTDMKHESQRLEQVASGEFKFKFELIYTGKLHYERQIDFDQIKSVDYNNSELLFPGRLTSTLIP